MKKYILLILVALLCVPMWAQDNEQIKEQNESGWSFDVTPYLWLAGVKADVGFRASELGQVQADFSDILQNLKMAALIHAEASNGKWIIMSDLVYMKIRKDGSLDLIETPTELEVKETVAEIGIGYNLVNNDGAFLVDGFAGLRHLNVGTHITIGEQEVLDRTSVTNDPFIGARFRIKSEDWMFNMRGDMGGFGIGSELSWKVNLLGAYQFSDLFSLYFGVQALGIDINKGDFDLDIMTTGLAVGGNFHF